jgi:hypothetical protein
MPDWTQGPKEVLQKTSPCAKVSEGEVKLNKIGVSIVRPIVIKKVLELGIFIIDRL